MSKPHAPAPPPPRPLYKQHSWSPPDAVREDVWLRRKGNNRRCCSKSLTDEDLEELKGCIELGFGFGPDSPDLDPKLSDTLPALEFYCAVNKQYSNRLSRSSSTPSFGFDGGDSGTVNSPMFDPGDDPEMVKTRLRQWAQVVACSVRQFSGEPN